MRSPADKTTIQIEITNACPHNCSHCTRHCGHQKKPFFMDFNTFKKAVKSLHDYPHTIGVMGGEPTLHPQFERFIRYYMEEVGNGKIFNHNRKAIPWKHILALSHPDKNCSRRGLWSSLGDQYYKHYELIQDVFDLQVLNDHTNPGKHQALLITRKELDIPDKEWVKLRNKCWVQNLWSASITPKGAFFCEIAAALDYLFNGPGGWPIEPGWWKRNPEDFGEQLNWCEYCSAPLSVPLMQANRKIDIISEKMYEKLTRVGSPKIKRKEFVIFAKKDFQKKNQESRDGDWYLPNKDSTLRVSLTNKSIKPSNIFICYEEDSRFGTIKKSDFTDWVLIIKNKRKFRKSYIDVLKNTILNPGCLYFFISYDNSLQKIDNYSRQIWDESIFIIFSKRASALKDKTYSISDKMIIDHYAQDKLIHLDYFPLLQKVIFLENPVQWARSFILAPIKNKILKKLKIR